MGVVIPSPCANAADYTGRGKELLIGFLIALAIIVPVYLAYFLAALEAERIRAFAGFPLLAFLCVFGQFAIYRAALSADPHGVARGAVLDERFGLGLCGSCGALEPADAVHPRADLAMAHRGA